MPQLLIEEVEPDLLAKLASRADRHGRSVSEEHLAILQEALGTGAETRPTFSEFLLEIPDVGEDSDFAVVRSDRDIDPATFLD